MIREKNFVYTFDEHCPEGAHELIVTVEDLAGNRTEKSIVLPGKLLTAVVVVLVCVILRAWLNICKSPGTPFPNRNQSEA